MIAIENLIRINRTLIFIFQPDFDFFFSVKPCLKIFKQPLVEKRSPRAGLRRGLTN
ncbi:hypothetical protein [Methanoregula sp.]|uniref:hypothetical protein n=1 Tax=Methanoregula sp. TaxID=2052170 RepID=UPI0035627AEA